MIPRTAWSVVPICFSAFGQELSSGYRRRVCIVYALEVMVAGLAEPGPDDIVEKIIADLARRGIPTTRGEILMQLSKKHRLAAMHFAGTDCL